MGIEHVIYRLSLQYPGGMRQLAEDLGRNYNVLINKLNPNVATHHVYIDELDVVVAFLDTDEVAKYFASQRGMFCVKSPGFEGLSDGALLDLFISMESVKAQWMEELKDALSDGDVSPNEAREIRIKFDALMSAAAEMMARIELYAQASKERVDRLKKD